MLMSRFRELLIVIIADIVLAKLLDIFPAAKGIRRELRDRQEMPA